MSCTVNNNMQLQCETDIVLVHLDYGSEHRFKYWIYNMYLNQFHFRVVGLRTKADHLTRYYRLLNKTHAYLCCNVTSSTVHRFTGKEYHLPSFLYLCNCNKAAIPSLQPHRKASDYAKLLETTNSLYTDFPSVFCLSHA